MQPTPNNNTQHPHHHFPTPSYPSSNADASWTRSGAAINSIAKHNPDIKRRRDSDAQQATPKIKKKAKIDGNKMKAETDETDGNKENTVPKPKSRKQTPAAARKSALAAQGDAALKEDEIFANGGFVWSIEDRTKLFEFVLGPDGDKLFEKLKTNPAYVHKKVPIISYCM